jgi:hypothetical protein
MGGIPAIAAKVAKLSPAFLRCQGAGSRFAVPLAADRVTHHIGAGHPEIANQRSNIIRHSLVAEEAINIRSMGVALQIDGDHLTSFAKFTHERC